MDTNEIENVYKVKLQHPSIRTRKVVFDVTPDLIENRNVNYRTLDPIHLPGQIYIYQSTVSRTFNISNARLISRTREEAEENLRRLQILRAWTVPVFGQGITADQVRAREQRAARSNRETGDVERSEFTDEIFGIGNERLGAPPNVLHLSAYSVTPTRNSAAGGNRALQLEHIRRVPCVVQQLSIPYPSDVDYIPSITGTPMPTVMVIDMTLVETHAPAEYETFNIADFRNGVLRGF